jgi:hypothetical protein
MKTLQVIIQEYCEDDCEISFRTSYSGRGMYGKSCVGITGSKYICMSSISEIITTLAKALTNQEIDIDTFSGHVQTLLNHKTDSMGYETIVYWPELSVVE